MQGERQRIEEAYRRRGLRARERYGPLSAAALLMYEDRATTLARLLREIGVTSLTELRILEVGCGECRELLRLLPLGASPANLFGVDLVPNHLPANLVRRNLVHVLAADGRRLPFPDSSFDVVAQFTMFTSILADGIRKQVASEMLRVLTPDGFLIWYDFYWPNPRNHDVRRVGKRALLDLFPSCTLHLRRVTLAPPIAHLLANRNPALARLLSLVPWLRSHYLAVIAPRATSAHPRTEQRGSMSNHTNCSPLP